MDESYNCKFECKCEKLCAVLSNLQRHMVGSGGELDPSYFSHHFDVGAVDDQYHLSFGLYAGQVLRLRLTTAGAGNALIDVDHLAGTVNQIQLINGGDWVELHWRNCQWNAVDGVGFACT